MSTPVYIDWSQWEMPAKPAKGFWEELAEKDGGYKGYCGFVLDKDAKAQFVKPLVMTLSCSEPGYNMKIRLE